jgi:large subunit ribosomal protein L29
MSKAKALRELTDAELETQLNDDKDELFKLRFQIATGKQSNSARLGQVRREIAQVSTILREREIDAAEQLAASEVKS